MKRLFNDTMHDKMLLALEHSGIKLPERPEAKQRTNDYYVRFITRKTEKTNA